MFNSPLLHSMVRNCGRFLEHLEAISEHGFRYHLVHSLISGFKAKHALFWQFFLGSGSRFIYCNKPKCNLFYINMCEPTHYNLQIMVFILLGSVIPTVLFFKTPGSFFCFLQLAVHSYFFIIWIIVFTVVLGALGY